MSSRSSCTTPSARPSAVGLTLFECAAEAVLSATNCCGDRDTWPSRRPSSDAAASHTLSSCRLLGNCVHLTPGSKAQVQLIWNQRPKLAFLVKKLDDARAGAALLRVGKWLCSQGVRVVVEEAVQGDDDAEFEAFDATTHAIDVCVCFGGDGTLLYLNDRLQRDGLSIPPVVAFAMGSLGFLTPSDVSKAEECLETVLQGHISPIHVSLRMRLWCELVRQGETTPEFRYQVLNECLLDRGGSSNMSSLELFVDDELITLVQADGVIVSTPTGSTAYSMSAGGSMVAPTVPAILVTPVCAHTLSFRPAVLPDASTIRLRVPEDARAICCVSFDGDHRREVRRGDEVRLFMSSTPFPTVNLMRFNTEWFNSIVSKLHWNVRKVQEPLPAAL